MIGSENTVRGWLATLGLIAGALGLYAGSTMAASLLLGSAVAGAAAANTAVFVAGLVWLRRSGLQTASGPCWLRGRDQSTGRGFWAFTCLSLGLCWIVGQASALWLYGILGSPGFDSHTQAKTEVPLLLVIVLTLVLAPMGEEMLVRGIAYTRLRTHLPPAAAAVITAGIFSLMHMNLVQIILTFPLGVLLAAVYERTGRLTAPILLHVAFNTLSAAVPVWVVSGAASLGFVLAAGGVLTFSLVLIHQPWMFRKGLAVPAQA